MIALLQRFSDNQTTKGPLLLKLICTSFRGWGRVAYAGSATSKSATDLHATGDTEFDSIKPRNWYKNYRSAEDLTSFRFHCATISHTKRLLSCTLWLDNGTCLRKKCKQWTVTWLSVMQATTSDNIANHWRQRCRWCHPHHHWITFTCTPSK